MLDLVRGRFVRFSGPDVARAGEPSHRARVEYNCGTILIHLSGEDDIGWTVLAVDRATRRWVVAQGRRQRDAAEEAFGRLYGE